MPAPPPRQRTSAGSALFVPSNAAWVDSQPAVSACRQLAARLDTRSGVCRACTQSGPLTGMALNLARDLRACHA